MSCEECNGTGIVGDEGPGLHNAHHEWQFCDACETGKQLLITSRSLRRQAIHDAEALATDLERAAKGHGIGNLDTLASLAYNILSYLKHV